MIVLRLWLKIVSFMIDGGSLGFAGVFGCGSFYADAGNDIFEG